MNKKLKQGAKALAARTYLSGLPADNKICAASYDEFMELAGNSPDEQAGSVELTVGYVWAPFSDDRVEDVAEYMENLYDDIVKTLGE